MRSTRQDESHTRIKIARRNINNLRFADNTTLMTEIKEEQKSLFMRVKEESEKGGLKLTLTKLRSWHLVPSLPDRYIGKQRKQCQTLFSWAPKSLQMVTAAMKLKDALLLGRKVMTNLDSIFKRRDIILPTKVRLVKAMVFPVVMYGYESWTVKKAER